MTASERSAALTGAAITAALAVWLLVSARIALTQGNAAADALGFSATALPMTQLLALLACGYPLTERQSLPARLMVLALLAAAPAPLAGVLFAMNAATPGELVLGQLAVAGAIVLVAGSGRLTERLMRNDSRLLTPLLQISSLLVLWTIHVMLAGRP